MDQLGGGGTHKPSPPPICSLWFSSCQRYAASVSLAAFHLFRCQWTGNSHSCTLLDIAGWQFLGLLQWVKSCNCLQSRGIWDASPALGCKLIHFNAVLTCMIKRGEMERDKMSLEDQLDEKGKRSKRSLINRLASRPRDAYTEKYLDLFLSTSHFEARWGRAWLAHATGTVTLQQQQQWGDTQIHVVLPCLFAWLSQEGVGQGWEAGSDKLWHYVSIPHPSFQFLVALKWLMPRMRSQNCYSM